MKTTILIVATALLLGCQNKSTEVEATALSLESQDQKVSYSLGANLAGRLATDGLPLDNESFIQAMRDVFEGKELQLTEEQMVEVMQAYQEQRMAEEQAKQELAATKNQTDSEAFLAANAAKEGVVVLDSGLQYKVINAGEGNMPAAADTVEVHYRGTLIDGTEFDSSYSRKETVSFPVNGVIPGWTEALQLMAVGSKWELYIPSQLGYGEQGAGGVIGPNAALVFEVELISISPATEAPAVEG
jgi:FKBP-type peptidyl-prolyl cis-trans isomerase